MGITAGRGGGVRNAGGAATRAMVAFASLPVITWRGEQIVVDLLDPFFRGRAAQIRDVLIDSLCGIVIFWPAIRVYELAERAKQYGDTTEYLQIPQFYIAYFIAFSTFVTALILLLRAVLRAVAPGYLARLKKRMKSSYRTPPGERPGL